MVDTCLARRPIVVKTMSALLARADASGSSPFTGARPNIAERLYSSISFSVPERILRPTKRSMDASSRR